MQKLKNGKNRFTSNGCSKHPAFKHWLKMRDRCYNHNNGSYYRYGGRGILICEEWQNAGNFCVWSDQNGYTKGLTIERKNNDLGYSPDNCKWATKEEQANNTSRSRFLEIDGERKTVKRWSKDSRAQVGEMTIRYRINNGWDDSSAVLTPPGIYPNRKGKPVAVNPGDVFGNLVVISTRREKRCTQMSTKCVCECLCGKKNVEKWAAYLRQQVKNGFTPSCGCVHKAKTGAAITAFNKRQK